MDANTVVGLIGSVGFPIVACCAMAWFVENSFRDFREALERNNALLQRLIDRLGGDEGAGA